MDIAEDKLIEELLDMNIVMTKINRLISKRLCSEEEFAIPPTQIMTIITLKNQPPVNMTQLSDLLNIPRQQLTKVIDGLVAKELVERYMDPNNRRVVMVELAPKGRELLHRFFFDSKSRLFKFIGLLDEDQKHDFIGSLLAIKRILSEVETRYRSPDQA